jgi:hypothetical protein
MAYASIVESDVVETDVFANGLVGFIPMLLGERPENRWPEEKNFIPAQIVNIGFVNKKTIIRSTIVVSPNVNANPRTPPTAKK